MGRERMSLGFGDDLDVIDGAENGAGEEAEVLPALDTSAFQPRKRVRVAAPELADTRKLAEAVGFRSREPKADVRKAARGEGRGAAGPKASKPAPRPEPTPEARVPLRRRRTGRNVQFNIKARPETIAAFTAIADANDWGFGETLEHAVALMQAQGTECAKG